MTTQLTAVAVVRQVSFEELVEHGRKSGAPIINGMPWSFDFEGFAVTHENDDCYLIGNMRFERGQTLAIMRFS